MPGRRRTSQRRKAHRPHVYRGQASKGALARPVVPERRSAQWNQWKEGWEHPVYTREQARELRLVTVIQIADRVQRSVGTVHSAMRSSKNPPQPVGILIDGVGQHHLLFAAVEVVDWLHNVRPTWLPARNTTTQEAGSSTMAEYGQITRQDLATFDKESTDMILAAMEAGVTGKVSRKSHAILRNAAGETMSISRKLVMHNRSAQNTRAQYKRFMSAHELAMQAIGVKPEDLPKPAEPVEQPGSWFCTLCQLPFPASEKDNHMAQNHPEYTFCAYVLEDGSICGALIKTQGRGAHIRMAHKTSKEDRIANAAKAGATRRRRNREAAAEHAEEPIQEPASPEPEEEPVEEPAAAQITDEQIEEILERPDEPQVELPEPLDLPVEPMVVSVAESVRIVEQIRDLLGKDPRITELEAQIVTLTEERDAAVKAHQDLQAKMQLLQEAFHALNS